MTHQVALLSQDPSLNFLLGPALGKDYELSSLDPADLPDTINRQTIDAVLLDMDLDVIGHDKREILRAAVDREISVVLIADDRSRAAAIELVGAGAHSHCRKPPALRELKTALQRACEVTGMKRRLKDSARQPSPLAAQPVYHGLVGSSAAMRHVCELIDRVANLNASVLVTGESGTGKELIARAIHNVGARKNQPFIPVSCGAIPETLIESELFGHEKGAFTGSTGTHCGYFEQAGGGTLFLDEIGELSPQTQVKLLRIIQQREFCRLGSARSIPLKARLIFATHRNLQRMVADGSFRLDLFYRVNVMTIHSPSLSERRDDVAALATHFVNIYSEMYDKYIARIHPTALQILREYEWPGNVRELENAIQASIIRAESDEILPGDLPDSIRNWDAEVEEVDIVQAGKFERLLKDYKVKLAMKALATHQGNKAMAARSLNISRAYIYRLLNESASTHARNGFDNLTPAEAEIVDHEISPARKCL